MNDQNKVSRLRLWIWPLALCLMGIGLFLFPMHLRDPFFGVQTGYYIRINWFMIAALVLLVAANGKTYSKKEWLLFVFWILLWGFVFASNPKGSLRGKLQTIGNCCLPVFLLLQRMPAEGRKKWIGRALLVFDCFIVILLAFAVYEKVTGGSLIRAVSQWFTANGYEASEYAKYVGFQLSGDYRFHFIWGHSLTNAVLFNAFFVLNDVYYRNIRKRSFFRKILIMGISMGGVLICASKTGIVVLALCIIISGWEQKLWLLAYAGVGAGMYAAGLFQKVLYRFTHTPLTSGRVEALVAYFHQDQKPLRFLTGYGAFTAYKKDIYPMRAAFEFPVLMFALDYGILFSVLLMGSIFLYFSWQCLKRRHIADWLMISLIFAELNTYNAMSLSGQDVCWMLGVFLMLALNAVYLSGDMEDRTVEISREK